MVSTAPWTIALVALATTVYLASLGKSGLHQVAELCYHKAHYAAARISQLKGYSLVFQQPFFKEFVVKCPGPVTDINRHLLHEWDIIGGYDLGTAYPELQDHMLVAVTETNTRDEIEGLIEVFEKSL